MVFSGGSAAKKGDYYEQIWTVRCILKVLRGEFDSIQLEPLGAEEEGFEFILKSSTGREYHQVKRQHSEGSWTLARLHQKKILHHFWNKLQESDTKCWFISTSDAQALRELTERSRSLKDWSYFETHGLSSNSRYEDFEELCKYLNVSVSERETAFRALKRIEIRTGDEKTLAEANETTIERMFHLENSEAKTIADVLSQIRYQRLHEELTKADILKYLADQNVNVSTEIPPRLDAGSVRRYLENLVEKLAKPIGIIQYVELETIAYAPDAPGGIGTNLRWGPNFRIIANQESASAAKQSSGESLENIDEAVSRFQRFILVGSPGAGKTTTLKHLALQTAYQCLNNIDDLRNHPIPFYVSLPAWRDDNRKIEEFVRAQFAAWKLGEDVIELLNRGFGVLYLDGLNEMGQSGATKASQIKQWLHGRDENGRENISILQPSNVIISCRKDAYIASRNFDLDLSIVEVEELDDQRIRTFAQNYLGEKSEDFLRRIFPQDEHSFSLLPLARNPYRLAILILLHMQSPSGKLPQNTGLLFQQMVRQLWATEQERRPNLEVSYQQILDSLSRLAFAMIDAEMPTSVSQNYALLFIENPKIMEAVKEILLVVQGEEVSFFHQSMQEYFAAIALYKVGVEHILTTRSHIDSMDSRRSSYGYNELGQFTLPDKWDQVVISLCGLIDEPSELVSKIARINPYLAHACINSGVEVFELNLTPSYLEALGNANIDIVGMAIISLGRYGDESTINQIIPFLYHDDPDIQYAANNALVSLGEYGIYPLVEQLVQRPYEQKREIADVLVAIGFKVVNELLNSLALADVPTRQFIYYTLGGIGNEETIETLRSGLDSKDEHVRAQCLLALGQIGALQGIHYVQESLSDNSSYIRLHAVKALALGFDGNEKTVIESLTQIIDCEESSDVLLEIIKVAGQVKGRINGIGILNYLLRDQRWTIHKAAYQTLEKLGTKKSLEYVRLFRGLRTKEHSKWVSVTRRIYDEFGVVGFIHALRHRYKDPQTYWEVARHIAGLPEENFLSTIIDALNDERDIVRNKAAYAIGIRNDPRYAEYLLPLLHDKAAFVRGEVVQAIGRLGHDESVSKLGMLLDDTATVYGNSPNRVCDYVVTTLKQIDTEEARYILSMYQESN
ncbi:MAG: HEAT repeat domain-containing protein [Anaerolineaceae bacterium]|nr:HEAT repeat domain-containing protein [Anaerolineaceae bacterium]